MTTANRWANGIITIAALMVVSAGCEGSNLGALATTSASASQPGASASDTATVASASDTATGANCLQMDVATNPIPQTIENMAKISSVILAGTFNGYGAAHWNTPDGSRPIAKSFRETSARLVRPLAFALDAPVRGDNVAGQHALQLGGALGCDRVSYSDQLLLQAGVRYVYFLAPVADSSGKVQTDVALIDAWPVGSDDVVQTRSDGPLPLAKLVEALAATPYAGTP